MSENKDLEIIVNKMDILIDYFDNKNDIDKVTGIVAAASRMAAENKQYKEITERLAASGNNAEMVLIEFKAEIERLKTELEDKLQQINDMCGCLHDYEQLIAELAKRPEIVRCGECSFSYVANNSGVLKCPNSFYPILTTDYCSAGVRRESEEQNDKM